MNAKVLIPLGLLGILVLSGTSKAEPTAPVPPPSPKPPTPPDAPTSVQGPVTLMPGETWAIFFKRDPGVPAGPLRDAFEAEVTRSSNESAWWVVRSFQWPSDTFGIVLVDVKKQVDLVPKTMSFSDGTISLYKFAKVVS